MNDFLSKKIGIVGFDNTITNIYDFEELSNILQDDTDSEDGKKYTNFVLSKIKEILEKGEFQSCIFSIIPEEKGFQVGGIPGDIKIGTLVNRILMN